MASGSPLRVLFAGTPDFAAHFLKFVLENTDHEVIAVYTQPDRPAGRGKKILASPVKQLAEKRDLPIYQPVNLKDPEAQSQIADLQPDIMLVVAYGLILPQAVLDLPAKGCINVHASLLPRWRGAAPIQRAIEAGDSETGVTIMQMDAGLDTGDMLAKTKCDISALDTAGSLHDKLLLAGETALEETLEQIRAGTTSPQRQDDSLSTYAPKISKQEALIDWNQDAEIIERKIRAFSPFPIAHTKIDDLSVRVHEAFAITDVQTDAQAGNILAADDQGIDVNTSSGVLRIKKLQLPGKRALPIAEVLRGNRSRFEPGGRFE